MSKRDPKLLTAYSPDQFDRILDLLARAGDDAPNVARLRLDEARADLEQDLLSLIQAVGLAYDGSEASAAWDEFERSEPSHKQLASSFRTMAKATRPLEPRVCKPELWPELNALIRSSWVARWRREGRNSEPSLRTVNWDTLTGAEQEDIRTMARLLARRHSAFLRQGAKRKTDADTVLMGLADIFLSYTRRPDDRYRLPYARESQFIKFAVLALEPAGAHGEFSSSALSNRWARLTREARKPSQRIGGIPKKKKLLTP